MEKKALDMLVSIKKSNLQISFLRKMSSLVMQDNE